MANESRKLRLIAIDTFPSTAFRKCGPRLNGCRTPGADIELLEIVLQIAGYEYEFIEVQNLETDTVFAMLRNGSVDMSALALRITPERTAWAIFTTPIDYLQYGYNCREQNQLLSEEFILHAFTYPVLLALLASIVVVSFVFRFLLLRHRETSIFEWLFRFASSMIAQYRFYEQRPLAILVLTASWLIFIFFVILLYQAGMKDLLLRPLQHAIAFQTLEEVLDAVEFHGWIAYEERLGYKADEHCNHPSECDRVHRLRADGRIKPVLPTEEIHDLLKGPKTLTFNGYNYDMTPYDISVDTDYPDHLLFIRDVNIAPENLAFALRKDMLAELEAINRALAMVRSAYPTVRGRYTLPLPQYIAAPYAPHISISILHVQTLMIAFCIAHGIAILLFIGELVYRRVRLEHWHFKRRCSFARPSTVVLPITKTWTPQNYCNAQKYTTIQT